jgi:hypothetical protein
MYRTRMLNSKPNNVSAKFLLKSSKPVITARILRPNVVLLANPETGVIIRNAHISLLKPYYREV